MGLNVGAQMQDHTEEATIMALATADMYRRDKLLIQLKNVWDDLSAEERSAVEVLVNSIILNHSNDEALFPPMTESELLQRIDRGIADADAGNFMDSEEFERELEEEFGLA
jgi:hypothetical protein